MLDFKTIASSSAGCCYVVHGTYGPPLLVEAGVRFKRVQQALDYRLTKLAGCVLSHSHGDHACSAKTIMTAGVETYASAETWEALGLTDHHRANTVELFKKYQVGNWLVTPFDAVHDAPGTFGYVIENGEDRLLFLTDSAYCKYEAPGLTHIAIECNFDPEIMRDNARSGSIHTQRYTRTTQTHMSIDRLVEWLNANDLSKVQEIRLLHLSDVNSNAEDFKTRLQKETGKLVYIEPATSDLDNPYWKTH